MTINSNIFSALNAGIIDNQQHAKSGRLYPSSRAKPLLTISLPDRFDCAFLVVAGFFQFENFCGALLKLIFVGAQ